MGSLGVRIIRIVLTRPLTGANRLRSTLTIQVISAGGLRVFFRGGEHTGFAAAARSLHVPPAVTRPIIAFALCNGVLSLKGAGK